MYRSISGDSDIFTIDLHQLMTKVEGSSEMSKLILQTTRLLIP